MKAIPTDIKHLILVICLLAGYTTCIAQKPVIEEIDKRVGANGEIVTLKGSFNGSIANTSVTFGATEGDVKFASEQFLEVAVPAGTTYDRIIVTDLISGLSDEGEFPFLYSFGGNHGLTAASFEAQSDSQAESGLYDLCMCDFDGDQRPDIGTASNNSNSISILANTTSTPGLSNISFNIQSRLLIAKTISSRCGDLNGDGKPDLVIAETGGLNRIFILKNTSSGPGVFGFSMQSIVVQQRPEPTPKMALGRIEIADLDNDGRPEVIVSNQEKNYFKILVNQSTTGAIVFAPTQLDVVVNNAGSTNGLAIADLNGDGLPEIVTSQFNVDASNIFIFENTSQPGSISFVLDQTLTIGQTVVNLRIGDLDGDMKPEIAATQLISSGTIAIFRNLSSSTNISFAPFVTFTTAQQAWGIDFGDIDGDGLADIVVSSISKFITVLSNKSTPGALNFSTHLIPVTYINRHVVVGDVDGDAKPDIVFTSIDNTSVSASKVSVIRNKSCLVPVINPPGPLTICSGAQLKLATMESNGANYEWKDGATTIKNGTDAFYDDTPSIGSHSYSVLVTSEGGNCSEVSNAVSVTVGTGGSLSGTASATNTGPVCRDNPLTLSVTGVTGADDYKWTGPGGHSGTGSTSTIASFQPEHAGRYYVDVIVGGCVAQQASTVVEMVSTPDFKIVYSGSEVICPPDTKTLTVNPIHPQFTYEWAERSTGNTGDAGPSVTVSNAGEYFVKATSTVNPGCAAIESTAATIRLAAPPVAGFSAPAIACTNQVIDFSNGSTGDPSLTLHYEWSFGNSQTSTQENPTYQYTTADTYAVTLKTTYDGGACASQTTKNITIQTAPNVSITTPEDAFELCVGGTLELGVSGSFTAYQWSTGATTPTIEINLPGDYSVDVTSGACILSAVVTVDSLASPVVVATADPAQVNEGQSSQLTATGLVNFLWEPAETLNDPMIATPVATPTGTTIYTVKGSDINGCPGLATIEVSVKGDLIVNKLGPSKFISPDNGDVINNYWIVEKILDYPQCSVNIFDEKGIKVYDAKPYNNDWDGTFNGKPLPDGVYYYVIRCDGEESTPRAGSITVLR